MSTAAEALRRPPSSSGHGGSALAGRLSLSGPVGWLRTVALEDWVTAGLLALMFVSVAWAVQLSGWGDLPSLIPTLFIGGAAGMWAARTRLKQYYAHPVMLALGFAIVMWQGSLPADGANVALQARDAWYRMFEWVAVARAGGISTDSVPFAMMMVAVSWVVAYIVAWTTFKTNNPWLAATGIGFGLLTDLSYRQGKHEQTFFFFIMAAVALFVHLTTVRRMARWKQAGIPFPRELRYLSVRDGVVLGLVVVAIAAVIPVVEPRSQSLNEQWKTFRRPIENLREPATRLLAGVRGRDKRPPLTAPGEVLAFQGPINLTEDPILWVRTRYPTYYTARIYQQYTAQGWLVGPKTVQSVPARAPSGLLPLDKSRERIEQVVQPLYDTTTVLPVGTVLSIDRDVSVDVLEPPRYVVPLAGAIPGGFPNLPTDIRDAATGVRRIFRTAPPGLAAPADMVQELERALARTAPAGVEYTVLVHPDTGAAQAVVFEREAPFEQIGLKLAEDVLAQDTYTVTTYISLADDTDLAATGSDYPKWVGDRYLQLPGNLPPRVRTLAQEIVARWNNGAGAKTPFEKTLAIAAFLRSQVYSQEIAGPKPDWDGVDYFLFETRQEPCPTAIPECNRALIKGYSQYYGSAASVLLRAVGVPSRMIAGWAQGEYVRSEGSFVIRDKDRHGWTQVYFAGYGWIDVEVTPGRSIGPRAEEFPTTPEEGQQALVGVGGSAFDEDLTQLQEDLAEAARLAQESLSGLTTSGSGGFTLRVPLELYYALAALGALTVVAYAGWWGVHRGLDPATRSYTKMVRAGWLLGIGRTSDQTPGEYAATVGKAAPHAADAAMMIAHHYGRLVYAHRAPGKSELPALNKAWRQVFSGVLNYRLSRLGSRSLRARRK